MADEEVNKETTEALKELTKRLNAMSASSSGSVNKMSNLADINKKIFASVHRIEQLAKYTKVDADRMRADPDSPMAGGSLLQVTEELKSLHATMKKSIKWQEKAFKVQSDAAREEKRKGNPFSKIGKSLKGIGKKLSPASLASAFAKALPSLPGGGAKGLLSGLGSLGSGFGLAAGGLGVLALGGSELLKTIENFDAKKVKENVNTLLSIGDDVSDGKLDFFLEGGAFGLAMTGIGVGLTAFALGAGVMSAVDYFTDGSDWAQGVVDNVNTLLTLSDSSGAMALLGDASVLTAALGGIGLGLAAFGVGSGVAAAVDFFTEDSKWAQNIVDNVTTLLSLKDNLGGNVSMLLDGGTFFLAMTGIGIGLAALTLGSAAAAALDFFTKDTAWAQNIVDNVTTLLSLKDNLGGNVSMLLDGAAFPLAMTGISIGLIALTAGSAAAAALDFFTKDTAWSQNLVDNVTTLLSIASLDNLGKSIGLSASLGAISAGLLAFSAGEAAVAIAQFMSTDDWTQKIVDNVETLLSIADLENMDLEHVGKVGGVLGALGIGLAAFGFGQAAAGVAEAINKFVTEEDFADKIKRQITTLLSVTDEMGPDPVGRATELQTVLTTISSGISGFGQSDLIDILKNTGEAILGFFGVKSPFQKVMDIADRADDLDKSVTAIERVNGAVNSLGADEDRADSFVRSMDKITAAMKRFAGGDGFWSGLADTLTGWVSRDPLKPFLKLADRGDDLFHAGIGVEKIANALQMGDMNVDKDSLGKVVSFAKDIKKEQKALDAAASSLKSIAKSVVEISKVSTPSGNISSLAQTSVQQADRMRLENERLQNTRAETTSAPLASAGNTVIADNSVSNMTNYTQVLSGSQPASHDQTDPFLMYRSAGNSR